MSFTVKTEVFEGPLDLLLSLIEKRKLFVNDISLAKVADDFIAHVQGFEKFPMNDSVNFTLIASTLLLIKSKSLLPTLTLTEEEEEGIHDLEARLKMYKRIKDATNMSAPFLGSKVFLSQNQPDLVQAFFFRIRRCRSPISRMPSAKFSEIFQKKKLFLKQ